MAISKLTSTYTFTEDRLTQLKQVVPEAFADDKVNWEALRELLGEYLEDEDQPAECFGLFWPGKREARRAAATPPQGALRPAPGEGVNEETTRHVFIEGENLEVLKLLRKAYAGRVKMIYIDPPYNTGNDFVYPDDYVEPVEAYLRRTGQVGDQGESLTTNSKTGGRYHSNWLNMMLPRLVLARELLRDDGVLFVSIDDTEVHNLRALMGEVFGEEDFVATFVWKRRASSALAEKLVSGDHEYLVAYQHGNFAGFAGKRKDYSSYSNPDNDPNGPWTPGDLTVGMTRDQRPNQFYDLVDPRTGKVYRANPNRVWAYIPRSMSDLIAAGRVIFPEDMSKRSMYKRYIRNLRSEVNPIFTWIGSLSDKDDLVSGLNAEGTRLLQDLFQVPVFNYSKPVSILKSIVQQCAGNSEVVLDFFAGSCAFAQAVLELNRQDGENRHFIMVQLPEPTGRADYPSIAEIGKERIRRVIARMQEDQAGKLNLQEREQPEDLGFRVYKLGRSQLKRWQPREGESMQEVQARFAQFESPLAEGWDAEALRVEVLLQEGFPLDSRVERLGEVPGNAVDRVSSEWCEHRLFLCLDATLAEDTVECLPALMGAQDILVCLDSALTDESKMRFDDRCNVHVI